MNILLVNFILLTCNKVDLLTVILSFSQMAKELHHSPSSSLLDKEPLNDIPEDNEEATTPSEDRILAVPTIADNNTTLPAIQIEVTCDDSEVIHRTPLSTIPEIQVMSDDGSDNDVVNEKGTTWTQVLF